MQNPKPDSAKRKWIIASAAVLAVLAAGALVWKDSGKAASSPLAGADFAEATIRSFPLEVVASGALEAKNQLTLTVPDTMGQATVAEVVPEGTVTRKDDVLCKFNTKELKEKEDSLKLAVSNAKAALEDAELSMGLQKETCASDEQSAVDKWETSKTELNLWEQGTDVQKRRDLKHDIETAQRELAIAQRDEKNNQALFAKQFISQSDLEKSDIALINAQEKLETAKLASRIYEDFTRKKERREKEVAIGQATLAPTRQKPKPPANWRRPKARLTGRAGKPSACRSRRSRRSRMPSRPPRCAPHRTAL